MKKLLTLALALVLGSFMAVTASCPCCDKCIKCDKDKDHGDEHGCDKGDHDDDHDED